MQPAISQLAVTVLGAVPAEIKPLAAMDKVEQGLATEQGAAQKAATGRAARRSAARPVEAEGSGEADLVAMELAAVLLAAVE